MELNELNELKILWTKGKEESIDEETLTKLVNRRSKSSLEKIKSRTRYENIANRVITLFFPVIIYFAYSFLPALIFFIAMGLMTIYYSRLYKKLEAIEFDSDTLSYTRNVYAAVKLFYKRYLIAIYATFPLLIIVVPFLLNGSNTDWLIELFTERDRLISLLIILGISFVLIYIVSYALYGRYLRRIKKDIIELEDGYAIE